jgi:hypothetical protein
MSAKNPDNGPEPSRSLDLQATPQQPLEEENLMASTTAAYGQTCPARKHRTHSIGYAGETPPQTLSLEMDMLCSIDAAAISCRWLNAFTHSEQKTKNIPSGLNLYIGRMLKSYAGALMHGSVLPPLIHPTQIKPGMILEPLANCLKLAKLCDPTLPGSKDLAIQLLEQEMARLFAEHLAYDAATMLAALQAYLLYTVMQLFYLEQDLSPGLRQAVLNLQQMASVSALQGTVSREDTRHGSVAWQTFVHVEAKRRTLYTMYLLDNHLCVVDNVPVFLAEELRGLPAPSSSNLWRAQEAGEWQRKRTEHMYRWPESSLTIDELWALPADSPSDKVVARSSRTARWLEEVDEYGTMLYAVTTITHGG